ncbi:MAG TPA: ribonuclease HIII [Bacillota bacterium]|nr:ribonuclease HIII [Bacillota bacterium]HOA14946.1 ribonuclease HIII [Bacillota bacterium]HOG53170.1 ribonuclease HIII [Bacillota bacterium]
MSAFDGMRRIGIDESGKGDYFGPLVIAAVLVDPEDQARLCDAGVKDSKRLSDKKVDELARLISDTCSVSVVKIGPSKYNELYAKIGNLNKLLAWGHSRALENVLEKSPDCDLAISDQFGDERFLRGALMKAGRLIELVQMPRAEQDTAVAAASIMARRGFVKAMQDLSEAAGLLLPKGASDPRVLSTACEIYAKGGQGELGKYAKLHFKTTAQVVEAAKAGKRGTEDDN